MVAQGARYVLSVYPPDAAKLMRKRGRKSLGFAPPDPRFPNTTFEWMLADARVIAREVAASKKPG